MVRMVNIVLAALLLGVFCASVDATKVKVKQQSRAMVRETALLQVNALEAEFMNSLQSLEAKNLGSILLQQVKHTTGDQPAKSIQAILSALDEIEAEINANQQRAGSKDQQVQAQCAAKIASMELKIEELKQAIERDNAAIAQANAHAAAAVAAQVRLSEQIQKLRGDIAALEDEIVRGDARRAAEQAEFDAKMKDIEVARAAIEEIRKIVDEGINEEAKRAQYVQLSNTIRSSTRSHKGAAALSVHLMQLESLVESELTPKEQIMDLLAKMESNLEINMVTLTYGNEEARSAWESERASLVTSIQNKQAQISAAEKSLANEKSNESDARTAALAAAASKQENEQALVSAVAALSGAMKTCAAEHEAFLQVSQSNQEEMTVIARVRTLLQNNFKAQHYQDSLDQATLDWTVGKWSACSEKCGPGTQHREVTCANKADGACGSDVPVSSRVCEDKPCPIDCEATAWSSWSSCNAPCAGGQQFRGRTIVIAAKFDGKQCVDGDVSEQSQACNAQACEFSYDQWRACDKPCGGGLQTRTATCPVEGKCTGTADNVRPCNTGVCPVWVAGSWGQCGSCNGNKGTQTRAVSCPGGNDLACMDAKPAASQPCSCATDPTWVWKRFGQQNGGISNANMAKAAGFTLYDIREQVSGADYWGPWCSNHCTGQVAIKMPSGHGSKAAVRVRITYANNTCVGSVFIGGRRIFRQYYDRNNMGIQTLNFEYSAGEELVFREEGVCIMDLIDISLQPAQ